MGIGRTFTFSPYHWLRPITSPRVERVICSTGTLLPACSMACNVAVTDLKVTLSTGAIGSGKFGADRVAITTNAVSGLGATVELAGNGASVPDQLGSGVPVGGMVCAVGLGASEFGRD